MSAAVTIIDYGVGNIASIANMLKKAGCSSQLAGTAETIENASRLILPGVGAYDKAAIALRESGLREAILERIESGVPTLGVCLGMQLLLDGSEEGTEAGLGVIPGRVRRFPSEANGETLRIPHMGWNVVHRVGPTDAIPDLRDGDRYYFVHSYYADPVDRSHVVAVAHYGISFACALQRDNVTGVQFHPEKSHKMGLRMLSGFARS